MSNDRSQCLVSSLFISTKSKRNEQTKQSRLPAFWKKYQKHTKGQTERFLIWENKTKSAFCLVLSDLKSILLNLLCVFDLFISSSCLFVCLPVSLSVSLPKSLAYFWTQACVRACPISEYVCAYSRAQMILIGAQLVRSSQQAVLALLPNTRRSCCQWSRQSQDELLQGHLQAIWGSTEK